MTRRRRHRGRHRLGGKLIRSLGWVSRPWYALTAEIEDRLEDRLQVWPDDDPIPYIPVAFPAPFAGVS